MFEDLLYVIQSHFVLILILHLVLIFIAFRLRDYNYPELHPVQGEDRQELWDAICDPGWNMMYNHGVSMMALSLPGLINCSFESFIGMDCPPPNWNEGLDHDLTKDLHLISAFHHLFDHTKFAITDFIYVRTFETEVNIEINKHVG